MINGRNNVLIILLIWQKKLIENREKSKITKHLIFPICLYQRETIYNLNKLEIDCKSVFLYLNATRVCLISVKQNNLFCACTIAKFSEKA